MLIREVNSRTGVGGGWAWGAGTGPGVSLVRTGVPRAAAAKWQPVKCFQTVAPNQSIKVLLLIRAAMCSHRWDGTITRCFFFGLRVRTFLMHLGGQRKKLNKTLFVLCNSHC